jgi:DNA-binding NtrC family response regulator
MANILVVDDELGIRDLLMEILNDEGHLVELAHNAAQARRARLAARPDLVLLDIWMPDTDGVTLLKEWSSQGLLTMPVIMMSGHATVDTAVEATKIGAFSFLEKPIALQKLLKTVEGALAKPMAAVREVVLLSKVEDKYHAQKSNANESSYVVTQLGANQVFDLDKPLRNARDGFEKAYFEYHLEKEEGSMTRVAEKTGLERTHLYRKFKQLGVEQGRTKKN